MGAGFAVIHNGLNISGGDTTSNGMKETGLQKDGFNLSDYDSNTNPITASLCSGGAERHEGGRHDVRTRRGAARRGAAHALLFLAGRGAPRRRAEGGRAAGRAWALYDSLYDRGNKTARKKKANGKKKHVARNTPFQGCARGARSTAPDARDR